MGIKIVPKKKKKGGRAVSNADAKRGGRAVSDADAKSIEEEAAQQRERRRELDAEMSPHRRALSKRMRRNSLKYNMSAPDHRKMSGPELTAPGSVYKEKRKRKPPVKTYARGGGVRAARF